MYSILGIALLLLIAWSVRQVGPGRSGVVTSGESPDGREYCIVQTFKSWIEPYQVSLYVRDAAGTWRWHYLEHEDNAWRSARVEFADGSVVVYRNAERFRQIELAKDSIEQVTPALTHNEGVLPSTLSIDAIAQLHHAQYR